ncbi:hypothetical protein Pan216_21040 [Planctomycetes bacterium Pan216]|uniref:Uncharacterized protein n=1 Tax=Kolteria novifilia TaxID=2527975 RepID=A0A518B2P0_9BACT|nr:hypothetical protein Pan216_21040 [Planctomycetes bacterium Pan216]
MVAQHVDPERHRTPYMERRVGPVRTPLRGDDGLHEQRIRSYASTVDRLEPLFEPPARYRLLGRWGNRQRFLIGYDDCRHRVRQELLCYTRPELERVVDVWMEERVHGQWKRICTIPMSVVRALAGKHIEEDV